MRDLVSNDPANAPVVHVSRPVRAEEVPLEDSSWELNAVLNGGVEGVHHCRGSVALPVSFIHLKIRK